MKSCVLYGPKDLRIEEKPVPDPGPGMVRLRAGAIGICGSDIHYYHLGRVGDAVIREPMILGHEIAGIVDATGPGVDNLEIGDKVVVNPSDECGECVWCKSGRRNLCPELRYYGSAARMPHVQGVMSEFPIVQARQCIVISPGVSMSHAALVEPLAIALHAVSRAGNLLGKRVFIVGAGPVGCLVAAVSRLNGASWTGISDLQDFPLQKAGKLGVNLAVNATSENALEQLADSCDACFEASGSSRGLDSCLRIVKRGGDVVHVGFQTENHVPYPVNAMLIRKEVSAHGSLRAYHEFEPAVRIMESGQLNLEPLVSGIFPLQEASRAIELAADKTRSLKILLAGPAATQ